MHVPSFNRCGVIIFIVLAKYIILITFATKVSYNYLSHVFITIIFVL